MKIDLKEQKEFMIHFILKVKSSLVTFKRSLTLLLIQTSFLVKSLQLVSKGNFWLNGSSKTSTL